MCLIEGLIQPKKYSAGSFNLSSLIVRYSMWTNSISSNGKNWKERILGKFLEFIQNRLGKCEEFEFKDINLVVEAIEFFDKNKE